LKRSEIVYQFRQENSEFPERVISDTVLNAFLLTGDKLFCAETRCIVDQGTTISTAENDQYFDLTAEITDFFDIDDTYASGVTYNGKRIDKKTMAQLDYESPNWRARSSGTPKAWFRRGKYLWLDRKIDSAADNIVVYSVLKSDDWNSDVMPYNQLEYLEPYNSAMVLYLTMRAKSKIGKEEEAKAAAVEYYAYQAWCKRQLSGNKSGAIYFQKKV
jgi:hypothetical protein